LTSRRNILSLLRRFAVRDVLIVLATASLWWLEHQLRAGPTTLFAYGVSVTAGIATGVCGHLLHEWGHLGGSLVACAAVEVPKHL
jgi:hypothetical protein